MTLKTIELRRKLMAYADTAISQKKLAFYEDFGKLIGMAPHNINVAKALAWLAECDLVDGRPLRSSVFVRKPKKQNEEWVKTSIPGDGYFVFCEHFGLLHSGGDNQIRTDFWKNELKKLGFKGNDLEEYGIEL